MYSKFLFDLDGVLVDTTNIQISSTIEAIHSIYDNINNNSIINNIISSTITTRDKLKKLCELELIKNEDIEKIYILKKHIANKHFNNLKPDYEKIELFKYLKENNCKIGIVTNGNKKSSTIILKKIGIYDFIDLHISNEDVENTKPHSEPYIKAICNFGGDLKDYIIFEDSETGLISARGTGVRVQEVLNYKDINLDNILELIYNINILIPMAGLGNRFKKRGFKTIKPLIDVNGKTMIRTSIDSLNILGRYIFIIRDTEYTEKLKLELLRIKPHCKIIVIDYLTEGSASSCYLAKEYINNDKELIITNCDQFLEWDPKNFLKLSKNYDCNVLTYNSNEPKNSFVKVNDSGKVEQILEKTPISNNALVGVHYFKKGSMFVDNCEIIKEKNIKIKGEYYLSTVCNQMINDFKVGYTPLRDGEYYHSLGTPTDYFLFLKNRCIIKKYDINNFYRGWLIGDFNPSIYKTKDFEIGYLLHKKGEVWDVHYHEHLLEINILIEGDMILNNMEIKKNDIFVIDKMQIAAPIFLTDCYIICIKIPSVIGDKIIL